MKDATSFTTKYCRAAAWYGLILLIGQLFTEEKTGRDYPPPITHPEFFYGFVSVAIAFQLVFLVIAKDPIRYRALLLPSAVEKLGFFVVASTLFALGRAPGLVLGFGALDLLWGLGFLHLHRQLPSQ